MAEREEILRTLSSVDEGESAIVLVSDLGKLSLDDVPDGVGVQCAEEVTDQEVVVSADITLMRGEDSPLVAFVSEEYWRKYWEGSLGLEEYQDLLRLAVEARQRSRGDVTLDDFRDENELVAVDFTISLPQTDLRAGLEYARAVRSELLEAAEAASAGVEDIVSTAVKRLQGWGSDPLDALVDRMREGTAHQKGLTLEELTSRLFNTVPGFTASGRVLTQTEEIDIRIQNASEEGVWQRESALLLAECKNWSGRCGKDEFVLFKSKLLNRTGRVSCGFFVSWNGFAETVTAEMLRGTEGNVLVVPIDGSDLRGAVRDGTSPNVSRGFMREQCCCSYTLSFGSILLRCSMEF